jgi:hypothetical protein
MRVLAEIVAADSAWLHAFNKAIDAVMAKSDKARNNPAALAKLDGYKRALVTSLSGNLQRFGFARVARVETLVEIIQEMDVDGNDDEASQDHPGRTDDDKDER